MDVAALAASLLTMQAGAIQQAMATKMIKMNLDAQQEVVQTLLQPPASSANLAAGIGGNLDISV
jgi:hypothetical protein